ncbi:MAG: hypothetical protein J7J76_03105 [Candidatus Latescibacteria bacterium]|nr:hypothetical protein [Candidatus Latescibacterota bacterium]
MDLDILKKACYVSVVCLVLGGGNALLADSPTTIYTPRGSVVPDTWILDEMSAEDIAYWNWYVEEYYPNATRLSDASRTYNCHGYAWHVSEGGNKVWIGYSTTTAEDIYWNDGSYDEMPSETNATKVSYSGNHSAITTSQSAIYISKWGALPLMRHHKNYCPGCYGSPSKYYRRSVDVPEDYSTIQAAINAAVSGQTVHVAPGTYNEQVSMKSGVDLIGAGSGSTTIQYSGGTAVTFNNVNARLSGFTLTGFVGVSIQNGSSAEVDHNTVTDSYVGIDVEGSNPTIHHNTISENGSGEYNGGGMYTGSSSHPVMYNGHNNIQDNGGYGIAC